VHYLNLVVDPLNQKLVQNRMNVTIGVNPITTKNNTIVILHLDDEERSSEQLAPYSKLHGDDASGRHRVAPTPFTVGLVFMSLSSSLPSFLNTEYDIRLAVTPLSMSILEIGPLSMWPQMYNGFIFWLDYSGFSNTASFGPRHI
jgi:hypothetical protein